MERLNPAQAMAWYTGRMQSLGDIGDRSVALAELAARYLWWQPPDGSSHSDARRVAQVMNLGTYDDIRQLEALLDTDTLGTIMANAHPGWFTPRSWEFWRGRLSVDSSIPVSEHPPRRRFDVRAAMPDLFQ